MLDFFVGSILGHDVSRESHQTLSGFFAKRVAEQLQHPYVTDSIAKPRRNCVQHAHVFGHGLTLLLFGEPSHSDGAGMAEAIFHICDKVTPLPVTSSSSSCSFPTASVSRLN